MLQVWQATFAGLTLVVFVITATIAILQLRHLRLSNQMAVASTLLQDYWTPQFQAWLHFVFYELSGRLEDPAYREELRQVPVDKTRHPEVYVCEYYAVLGSCFKNGLMQRKIFLANGSFDTVCAWSRLRVPIALMREAAFPTQYKDFEDLASLCRDWLQAHGLRWEDVA